MALKSLMHDLPDPMDLLSIFGKKMTIDETLDQLIEAYFGGSL